MSLVKLDGIWKALPDKDGQGEKQGFYREDYDDSEWFDIRVPGHWQEEIEDLKDYSGIVWYRKKFRYEGKGRRIWLRFGGVFYKAKVWLNGRELGEHEGYFASFKFDITEIVKGWVSGEYPNYGIILVLYVKVFNEKEYCPSAPQFSYYAIGSRESFAPKLIVTYEEPSLEVSSTPNGNTVRRGETAFYTIEVKSYVYTENVELSLSGLPSGTTYAFSPAEGTGNFTSTLAIITSTSTPIGNYTITVTVTGVGVSNSTQIWLKVERYEDFTFTLNPANLTIEQGGSGEVQVLLNSVGEGYPYEVTMSCLLYTSPSPRDRG